MRQPSHKLGYPSKSLMLSSGGESTSEAFEHMLEDADLTSVIAINAIIDGLPNEQQAAISARYLEALKPKDYESLLSNAMDNLLSIATRRGMI